MNRNKYSVSAYNFYRYEKCKAGLLFLLSCYLILLWRAFHLALEGRQGFEETRAGAGVLVPQATRGSSCLRLLCCPRLPPAASAVPAPPSLLGFFPPTKRKD